MTIFRSCTENSKMKCILPETMNYIDC